MSKSFISNIFALLIEMAIIVFALSLGGYAELHSCIIICLGFQAVHLIIQLMQMARVRRGFKSKNLEAIADTFPAVAELMRASQKDKVTSCYTRAHFEDIRGKYEKKPGILIAFFDVNNLKIVNDKFGHETGDGLLSLMGHKLSELNYLGDIFRWGGDEFLFIATDSSEHRLHTIEKKIKDWYESSMSYKKNLTTEEGTSIPLEFAMGINFHTGVDYDIETLVREADESMYKVKASQKGNV